MPTAEAPKVGVREVVIVATPLLTLLVSAALLYRSLPALDVRDLHSSPRRRITKKTVCSLILSFERSRARHPWPISSKHRSPTRTDAKI